jgi:RNA polymerase sigma-70 factor (ECF subfamily)
MGLPMTAESDPLYERLLVLRCQAGDEQAFAEMIRSYDPRLRYFLLKLLADRHAAEDAAQDVWLDVYRGLVRLREPGAFRAWLYRLARDRALRKLRATRPTHVLLENDDVAVTEESDERFSKEDAEQIHAALDTLSPEHREVLVLRFIEDLSYDEIEAITGCRPGTVKSRIHYAKQMLRRAIEKETNHD